MLRSDLLRRFSTATAAAAVGMALILPAAAETLPLDPDSDLVGEMRSHRTVWEDTFALLARHNGLGFIELVAANPGIDPWVPGKNVDVVLPTAHLLPDTKRKGIVINLPEQRLYYFAEDTVTTFPIGTGKQGWETPLGSTKLVRKRANPTWTPPASVRAEDPTLPAVVPPGPDNPLGEHALYLGWPSYLIHGTNKPFGVGRRVSHGCIRLYPEDIEYLYEAVALGAPVEVIDQPIKLGWHGGDLYLEAHPNQLQLIEIEKFGHFKSEVAPPLETRILNAARDKVALLDWDMIRTVLHERRGLPVRITGSRLATRQWRDENGWPDN